MGDHHFRVQIFLLTWINSFLMDPNNHFIHSAHYLQVYLCVFPNLELLFP